MEAAEKLEKAEAAVERRELFKERMLREEEIAQLNAKMDRAQMVSNAVESSRIEDGSMRREYFEIVVKNSECAN